MPAKSKKPAAKKPAAKPAKKAAPKKAAKPAVKSKSKPAPQAAKAPHKAPPKAAPKKPSPKPVKKAAPKKAPAAAAKKAPAKKAAAEKKPAAKPAAPAPVKAAKPAPAPAPAPEPVKAAKPAAPAKSSKNTPAPLAVKGRTTISTAGTPRSRINRHEDEGVTIEIAKGPVKMTPFLKKQKQRLVELRDAYLNSIEGVASETIRNENGDSSAFGMHQADAGSDAYDRDFALSLLGKEQDALYEINEALKRIETGTYGLCEGTGVRIPEERLEAMPFARYSVTYQEKIERSQITGRWSRPVHSLFGLDSADAADDDDKDEDEAPTGKNNNSGESLDFSKE